VGWNPNVNPPGFDPTKAGNYGIIAVDNSSITHPQSLGAVYKGLAIATTEGGSTFLYATDFRFGRVEIYGSNFELVTRSPILISRRTAMPHSTSSRSGCRAKTKTHYL